MNKKYTIEENIYRLFGIKQFQKLVFWLEKTIHRKDKGVNKNYHLDAFDPYSVSEFSKYLYYNGSVHVRNIVILIFVYFVRFIIFPHFGFFDLLFIILAIKDFYCIMLQRYNFIRIRRKTNTIVARKNREYEKKYNQLAECGYCFNDEHIDEDLQFIMLLKSSVKNGVVISINENSLGSLRRLNEIKNSMEG